MKYPELKQPLEDLETHVGMIYDLQKKWMLASDGAICGSCEFLVPALAKRTNAFIDAFGKMVRCDNHYAATLFIRPMLEHVLIAVASDEYEGGHHAFAEQIISGNRIQQLKSSTGTPMSERYLVKRLQARLGPAKAGRNVTALYDWSNSFVHFGTQQALSLVDKMTEGKDGESTRFEFSLRGATYEIPLASQKDVMNWINCMVGIAELMELFLENLIEVRRTLAFPG